MAARYRKIDPRIWTDETFVGLSATEKLVALNILTDQSNRCGLFSFSPALAAERLCMSADSYAIAFSKVCHSLKWSYDSARRVIYIPTWFKYNKPENPNHLKGCLKDLHDLPQTPLIKDFAANEQYIPSCCLNAFKIAMTIAIGVGMPNLELELEQEQNTPHTPQGGCVSPEGDGPHGAAPERAAGSSPDGEVSVTPDGVAGFDRFWAAWPKHHRKVGKSKCLRLWKRLKLESVAEQVIAALRRCKASPDWTKENGQYIPMPHSWLNKTPWETDPTELEGDDDLYSNGFTPAPVTDEILALLDAPACNADAFSGAGMGHESSEQEKRASVDGRGQ